MLHAITTQPLTNNTLPAPQKTKLDILPLPPLLFDKGFTISKLKSFPYWETIVDRRNGSLLCCQYLGPLGNRTRNSAVGARRHNHFATGNCCVLRTHYVERQLALKKTLLHAIGTHLPTNNTPPVLLTFHITLPEATEFFKIPLFF